MRIFRKIVVKIILLQAFASTAQNVTSWQETVSKNFENVKIETLEAKDLYDAASISKADHTTSLTFLMFRNTGWTKEIVLEHLEEILSTYNTDSCRIIFKKIHLVELDPLDGKVDLDWATVYQKTSALTGLDLKIAKLLPEDIPRPVVGLLKTSYQMYSAYASPKEVSKGFKKPLLNTTWILNMVNTETYKKRIPEGYNPIAHELAHVLFNYPYHDANSETPHILSDNFDQVSNAILPEQCDMFPKSGL